MPSGDPIVVLGAGPAGMSAAWRLSELGRPVTVLEKDRAVGGMGKTITVGKYAVDYGPHTFHIRETEESRAIHEAIKPLFGDDPLILTRGTRVLLRGKEYIYPLEMLQVLRGVSPLLSFRIVGRTLYDLCFGIYSARVWGLPTSQISSKQAQRVAKLNLKNIILRTLGIKADPATYFTKYMYPRQGISVLYERMARVVYQQNGREETLECAGVLSTLPLPQLVGMIDPPLPPAVAAHASK